MADEDDQEQLEVDWWDYENFRPKNYAGILRKPLPSPYSPDFPAEWQRRYEALCQHYGVGIGDTETLLVKLVTAHVPGFRNEASLELKRIVQRKPPKCNTGRPKKLGGDLASASAFEFYKRKVAENRLNKVQICELWIAQFKKGFDQSLAAGRLPPEAEGYKPDISPETLARKMREMAAASNRKKTD